MNATFLEEHRSLPLSSANPPLSRRDLLGADDISADDLADVFDRTSRFLRDDPPTSRPNKVVATFFEQRSTRTRLGFQAAATRLGHGSLDAYEPDKGRMGTASGESLEDHIRTVAAYSDLIVVRSPREGMPAFVAGIGGAPVINGGNGADEHPTQALVDVFSIQEMRGDPRELSIALSCDLRARFALSFVKLLGLLPPRRLTLCHPEGTPVPPAMSQAIDRLAYAGTVVATVHDVRDTLDHDVLNIQMQDQSRFANAALGGEAIQTDGELEDFRLTGDKLRGSSTLVLNPMPRFAELDVSCDATPNAGYFRQVELSLPIRMAVLDRMLSGHGWSGRP